MMAKTADTLTKAPDIGEDAIVRLREKLLEQGSLNPALASVNEAAFVRFKALGFPHKKHEMYTFVDTKALPSAIAGGSRLAPGAAEESFIRDNVYPGFEKSVITLVDGFYSEKLSSLENVKEAVSVESLGGAGADDHILNRMAREHEKEEDVFAAINGVFFTTGVVIRIKGEAPAPLQILNVTTTPAANGAAMAAPRVFIDAASGAKAELVLKYTGTGGGYLVNSVTDISMGEGSALTLYEMETDNAESVNLSKTNATLSSGAKLDETLIRSGQSPARRNFECRLQGEGAAVNLKSVAVLDGKEQAHAYLRIHHEAPGCESELLFRNIVGGAARSSVDGTVIVHPGAQETFSNQLINNLMLSAGARADAKPNLMIYADDVKCSHGSTVGRIDEDQIFYLRTRNFTEQAAKALLTASFASSVLDTIGIKPVREEAGRMLLGKLGAGE